MSPPIGNEIKMCSLNGILFQIGTWSAGSENRPMKNMYLIPNQFMEDFYV